MSQSSRNVSPGCNRIGIGRFPECIHPGTNLQTRHGTDWQPYEPMFAVNTEDGECVQEPVMRRQIGEGRWEYRRMTPAEATHYARGLNRRVH